MRTVRDVMCPVLEVLRTTDTVADAASYLASPRRGVRPLCLPDGSLAGTVQQPRHRDQGGGQGARTAAVLPGRAGRAGRRR